MGESSFRSLEVWRLAMDLTVAIYGASGTFPRHEMYGVTSQLRRAAASVPANIAEGKGREHTGDYVRHLLIARGSPTESETFVEVALRLNYLKTSAATDLVALHQRVGQMLNGLIRALRKKRDDDKKSEG